MSHGGNIPEKSKVSSSSCLTISCDVTKQSLTIMSLNRFKAFVCHRRYVDRSITVSRSSTTAGPINEKGSKSSTALTIGTHPTPTWDGFMTDQKVEKNVKKFVESVRNGRCILSFITCPH